MPLDKCSICGRPTHSWKHKRSTETPKSLSKRPRKVKHREDSREANHIDGYDRDDLGSSPDY